MTPQERTELRQWVSRMAFNGRIFEEAYLYAHDVTGLSVEEIKQAVLSREHRQQRLRAAKWVDHYLNECRKGSLPQ